MTWTKCGGLRLKCAGKLTNKLGRANNVTTGTNGGKRNSAVLGYYEASSGHLLSTFRDVLLNMERSYHHSLRNDPEERSSHLLRGRSLKSRSEEKFYVK